MANRSVMYKVLVVWDPSHIRGEFRMRKFAFLFALSILAVPTVCQEFSRVEVFGGYSQVHKYHFNQRGWNAQATVNLNKWFGVTADFAGHDHGESLTTSLWYTSTDGSMHTFTVGPTFSYRARVTPFAHVLLGGANYSSSHVIRYSSVIGWPINRISSGANAFAVLTGGGIDIPLHKRFAIRPVQADWLLTRYGGRNWNYFRYSGGGVFRF